MTANSEYDVFLSHSSKDKAVVRPLAESLRADGLRVWFDEWEIRPGDNIPAKIEEGLEQSRVLVLCMSANAFGSDWAQLEAGTFRFRDPLNKARRFIPLRLDDAPIKGSLAQFLYIDWHETNRKREYGKLLQACRSSGEEPVSAPSIRAPKPHVGFDVEQYLMELDRLFADSRIADWYVSLAGYREFPNGNREAVNVEDCVDSWLTTSEKGRLAVLGDYGTGKSWLCLRLAKRMADAHRGEAGRRPLPLLVSFKRYQANMDLVELIRAELFDGYGIDVQNPPELRRGLQSGAVLPILDGLDEMAKALGERTALIAYSRLGLASEIPKVIVTCRTHYFHSGSEQREFLSRDAGYCALSNAPDFDIVHLQLLDKPRIRACIMKRFDPAKAGKIIQFVESTYNLPELCSRPVLLFLVCESHDQLPHLADASSSPALYEVYIDSWLYREFRDGRLAVEPDAVKRFFEDLAERMVNESTLVIDNSRLKQCLTAFLEGLGLPSNKWKEMDRQVIASTFVRRSIGDGWQFAHRSFQEFFYARKFFRWEEETGCKGEFPVVHTPIWQFIAQMVLTKWNEEKALHWIRERVARDKDPTLTLTTVRAAAGYWLLKKRIGHSRDYPLSGIMLDSVDLTGLDLARCHLSRADFHGSDLSGADLSSADLSGAQLTGAQFLGARLANAKLDRCDIAYADFRGASFGPAESSVWANTVNHLKSCEGLASALFDQEVASSLK